MQCKTSDTLRTVALERGNHVVVTFGFEVNCARSISFTFIYLLLALGLCCCVWTCLYLEWVEAALCYGAQASHCGGFSCCRAQALGIWAAVAVTHRLINCGSRALEHASSIVVVHQLSCCTACAVWTCVPYIGRQTPIHCTTREAQKAFVDKEISTLWPFKWLLGG